MRSASSFNNILLFDERCCLNPIWLVWVMMDDKSDSVGLPFTITGFRYVDENIFSVFTIAFCKLSECMCFATSLKITKECMIERRRKKQVKYKATYDKKIFV